MITGRGETVAVVFRIAKQSPTNRKPAFNAPPLQSGTIFGAAFFTLAFKVSVCRFHGGILEDESKGRKIGRGPNAAERMN